MSSFSPEELRIVHEDSDFELQKRHLHSVASRIDDGKVQFCSFQELDIELDAVIAKYEN